MPIVTIYAQHVGWECVFLLGVSVGASVSPQPYTV